MMDDAQLAEALGIEPCRFTQYGHADAHGPWWECTVHSYSGTKERPSVCGAVAPDLEWARKGMDLARQGIAAALTEMADDGRPEYEDAYERAANLARDWQPGGAP